MKATELKNSFYLKTLSGNIIALNIIIFIFMSLWDSSLFIPSQKALLFWGSSDAVELAKGHWWRLITGNFVHFGLIHLWLNCFALKIIGYEIEKLIGKKIFLFIYLITGVCALLASALLNVSTSAGASGAIFGLIGIGVVIETIYNYRFLRQEAYSRLGAKNWLISFMKRRPFLSIAIINMIFALVVNLLTALFGFRIKVDNAAHTTGMISGMLIFYGFFLIAQKKRSLWSKTSGLLICLVVLISFIGFSKLLLQSNYVKDHHISKAKQSKDLINSYYHYTQVLKLSPLDQKVLFRRGEILLLYGDLRAAAIDFEKALILGHPIKDFQDLINKLIKLNKKNEAQIIYLLLSKYSKTQTI